MNILMDFPDQENLQKLWSLFPSARLVGGAVRDMLIKRPVADVDMATPDSPERVLDKLRHAGIRAIPTGMQHGTVTALFNHRPYEITTLRRDVKTDGRHAQVLWTDDWQEDAARRDFTINALYCDRNGTLWDYHQGYADLLQGKIRFIGVPQLRIAEDFLRILRYFRFYARYGAGPPDSEAMQAIRDHAKSLTLLSAERIWVELQKILTGPVADEMVYMMDHVGVLPVILPFGYSVDSFSAMVRAGTPPEGILRLSGLVTAQSSVVASQLRISRKQERLLSGLQNPLTLSVKDSDRRLTQLRAIHDLELLLGKSWLVQAGEKHADPVLWEEWRKRVAAIPRAKFPLSGRDLVRLGMGTGPRLGERLRQIKGWWLQGGCVATAEECLEWFKRHTHEGNDKKD